MDGVWVYPVDDSDQEESQSEGVARPSEASTYLVVFLEPERSLALAPSADLGHSFRQGERVYDAMDEVLVYDWMTSPDGRLVGVRNLLPPESLLHAYQHEKWPWISHEQDELRIWFGEERGADLSQTVHRCVFADPFRSSDGRLALAYDTYGLKAEELERLRKLAAHWLPVAAG